LHAKDNPTASKKMKKTLLLFLFLGVGLVLTAQRYVEGCCYSNISSFAKSIGTASFATDSTWKIERNGITQIWSDVVQTTGCLDSNNRFRGDTTGGIFLAACRNNPLGKGSFFTWCAVAGFDSVLCPPPWRIPTADDFCNLDKSFDGSATCYSRRYAPEDIVAYFINKWGGALHGATSGSGTIHFRNLKAYYWSQTEFDEGYTFLLTYDAHGNVVPRNIENIKSLGVLLRCVR
jgi:uncharacterized protein (TIGR02145 family)